MNWDAIGAVGEVLGAVGVLITLIYFGFQLRKTQKTMEISSFSATSDAQFALNTQMLDHADLVIRADKGENLSDVEAGQFRILVQNASNHSFFTYVRQGLSGRDQAPPVMNFSSWLNKHPAARAVWLESLAASPDSGMFNRWLSLVRAEVDVNADA